MSLTRDCRLRRRYDIRLYYMGYGHLNRHIKYKHTENKEILMCVKIAKTF